MCVCVYVCACVCVCGCVCVCARARAYVRLYVQTHDRTCVLSARSCLYMRACEPACVLRVLSVGSCGFAESCDGEKGVLTSSY